MTTAVCGVGIASTKLSAPTPSSSPSLAVGHGSHPHGGAPARMGHRVAFGGNTAEHYRRLPPPSISICMCVPHAARGSPAQGPLSHDTGIGWVAPHLGQYADSLSRGTKVLRLDPSRSRIIGEELTGFALLSTGESSSSESTSLIIGGLLSASSSIS